MTMLVISSRLHFSNTCQLWDWNKNVRIVAIFLIS